jgi:parvulin-like peptidyl-prolyl isomerase
MRSSILGILALGLVGGLLSPVSPAGAQSPAVQSAVPPVIVVGDYSVAMPGFEATVREAMRQKYYHGKVPEAQLQALPREIADRLVNEALLVAEAKRRGLKPSAEQIQETVRSYDERYGSNPNWKQNREQMLPKVVPELERRNLLEQLERNVRAVSSVNPGEVRKFYEAKKDLFTEPEKLRLSLIMLKVDPSAGRAAWDKAQEEAAALHKRLSAGADFAEAARLHSADESAPRGGDMGYLHRGMLTAEIQEKVDAFKLGQIQPPIVTLHGVAILRLDERISPKLRSFEDVKSRAEELFKRERGETAWNELIARLRSQGKFLIREEQFADLIARLR